MRLTSNFLWLCAAMLACNSDTGLDFVNFTPEVRILAPDPGEELDEGVPLTAQGNVQDANENDVLTVRWFNAAGDTLCEQADVEPGAVVDCPWTPTAIDERICLFADDGQPENSSAETCVTIVLLASEAPTAEIIQPVSSGVYYSDTLITFEGILSDAEDDPENLVALWSSSIDGDLEDIDTDPSSEGDILGHGLLSEGQHAIELTVWDSTDRQGQISVVIDVGPPNSEPSCSIVEPADGATSTFGSCVSFEGTVADANQSASSLAIVWSSDLDGTLSEGTADSDGSTGLTNCDLSPGFHQITLAVTDDGGAECVTSHELAVGTGPTCEIMAPSAGDTFYEGDALAFEATVEDDSTAPADMSIAWESSLDGVFDTTAPDSLGTVLATWAGLSVGSHAVTLTATDADGFDGRCSISDLTIEDCLRTWYDDLDADGYGDDTTTTETCSPPSGYVLLGGDCDDGKAAINPAATETCDGIDEDCDGTADDGVTYSTWYLDADGDGYGDSTSTVSDCAAPTGYVSTSGPPGGRAWPCCGPSVPPAPWWASTSWSSSPRPAAGSPTSRPRGWSTS